MPPTAKPGATLPFKQLLDNLYDSVYFVDRPQRRITYWNHAARRLTGYSAAEVLGVRCADALMHVDEKGRKLCGARRCPVARAMRNGKGCEAEVYLCHKAGHRVPISVRARPLRDKNGRIIGAVEVFTDNKRLARAQGKLGRLEETANTDPLTGICNRRRLEAVLASMANGSRDRRQHPGVLLVDVDQLKAVNDTHGHAAGDAVLKAVARTLAGTLRSGDTVGRWGGDEFLVVVPHAGTKVLRTLAERCRVMVQRMAVAVGDGRRLAVTVSIGGALAWPGETVKAWLHRADVQLYDSKRAGRNRSSLERPGSKNRGPKPAI